MKKVKKNNEDKKFNYWLSLTIGIVISGVIIGIFAIINCCVSKGKPTMWLDGTAWISLVFGTLGVVTTSILSYIAVWQNIKQRDDNSKNIQVQLNIVKNQYQQLENSEYKKTAIIALKSFNFSVFSRLLLCDNFNDYNNISSTAYKILNDSKIELEGLSGFCCDYSQCTSCQNPCLVKDHFSQELKDSITDFKELFYKMFNSFVEMLFTDCDNLYKDIANNIANNNIISQLEKLHASSSDNKARLSCDEDIQKYERLIISEVDMKVNRDKIVIKKKELEIDFCNLQFATNKLILNFEKTTEFRFERIINSVYSKAHIEK